MQSSLAWTGRTWYSRFVGQPSRPATFGSTYTRRHEIILAIGCGAKKLKGSIGIDIAAGPGVDCVLNLEADRLPFPKQTVDHVYSSHCFEHITSPNNLWREISRVIKPGGTIEIWTPYPHSDDQWLIGHVAGWGEARWNHVASQERGFYSKHFLGGGFWKWNEARYVIDQSVTSELQHLNIPVPFAVQHMVNVVKEWGCFFEYVTEDPGTHEPTREFVHSRSGQ